VSTDELDPNEQEVADRLRNAPPRPSPALRRRVRDRIGVVSARQGLRRRSIALTGSGVVLLVVACVLAAGVS
jgi:hypothetical protein